MTRSNSPSIQQPAPSRGERFYGGYTWLILKNAIGWTLILASLVAGPFVPGPGGIPLFLIGFAFVSFPGKRNLTARVLRGRRIALRGRTVKYGLLAFALTTPLLALWLLRSRVEWFAALDARGPHVLMAAYLVGALGMGLVAFGAILTVNLVIRIMPPIRRRVRPWLRHHHIRLLPPRYRQRLSHEAGTGPVRLKGEILAFIRKRHRPKLARKGMDSHGVT